MKSILFKGSMIGAAVIGFELIRYAYNKYQLGSKCGSACQKVGSKCGSACQKVSRLLFSKIQNIDKWKMLQSIFIIMGLVILSNFSKTYLKEMKRQSNIMVRQLDATKEFKNMIDNVISRGRIKIAQINSSS